MPDYKRKSYLQREIQIALHRAKSSETDGRYAEAAWWEERAKELSEELEAMAET